jgi:hypothetical protein
MQGPAPAEQGLDAPFDERVAFLVQEVVTKRPGAAALLLCLALLASCEKATKTAALAKQAAAGSAGLAGPAAPSVAAAPTVAAPPALTKNQTTITLKKEQAPPRPQPAVASAGVQSLLVIETPRLLPEDFKIGPLGDAGQGTADGKSAFESATALLASLVSGKVDAKLLASDSAQALLDMLAFGFEGDRAPTSFRLGAPVSHPDGEITVNARLFRGPGATEGVVYLRRENREWLVADIQISAAGLAEARERPKQKFFPSPYRWLLGE